ncbi:MAG: hypothetical protein QUS13_08085 [Smithella sp.]|nr:hypothetical protein [Smithella sp.]
MILNNRGLTIIESLIAVMLTGVAVIGLLTMQPLGMQSAGKADSMTRATQLMQRELETLESRVMAGANVTTLVKTNASETIGNETFTINTTITVRNNATWLARVRVTWPGNTNGVRSSLIVSRQSTFD